MAGRPDRIIGRICGSDAVSVIELEDGRISDVRPFKEGATDARPGALGGPDLTVAPALMDIQVNGFGGRSVGDAESAEDVARVVESLHGVGVGLYCPTVTTRSAEDICSALRTLASACEDPSVARATAGIHLEGPYISEEDGPRGAHPREHARDPDWDEFRRFQDAAGGRIRIVTLAPERPGAIEFIEKLAAAGLVPAIGHTGADTAAIEAAVKAGALLSTHLGNGAHAMLPRHPNYIWDQLAADELWISIIPDGHHLPPAVVKCMVRAKGIGRTILVSDAVWCAGLPPESVRLETERVEMSPDGAVRLKGTPFLAGSALELSAGVANAVRFAGVSLAEAVRMATLNPAQLLGLDGRVGMVEAGKDATLMLFRWDEGQSTIETHAVLVCGEVVWRAA